MSCSKRGEDASCTYSNPEGLGRDKRDCGYRDSEAQLRLQRLEKMVTSLIQTNNESFESRTDRTSFHIKTGDGISDHESFNSSPQTSEMSSEGHMSMKPSEKVYVNATHWTAILENVGHSCLRRDLQCPANVHRSEKFKTLWSRRRTIASINQSQLPLGTLTWYSAQLSH